MSWVFAIVNGKLAEIYFDNDNRKKKTIVRAHCYVKKSEYKTKQEKKWIKEDTKKNLFVWRNKKYKQIKKIK